MVNISSAGLFGIGASGLKAAQEQIKISSHNIANADTIGFTRSDAVYTERAVRAGVDIAAVSRYDKNLERVRNDSTRLMSSDDVRTTAMSKLSTLATNAGVGNSYNEFVSTVYDFRQRGSTQDKTSVDNWGGQVASSYNDWVNSVSSVKADLQISQTADIAKLTQMQVQFNSMSDSVSKSVLKEELSALEGKLAGQGELISKTIPDLERQSLVAMATATDTVNAELGSLVFSIDQNGKVAYDGAQIVRGDNNDSISGDTIGKMMSQITNQLGFLQKLQENSAAANQEVGIKLAEDYQKQVGVDPVDEQLKILKAQRMYEAMSKIIQIENENLKTLIDIV